MNLEWISPVINAVKSIITVVTQPPFSYFIGLYLVSGVIYTIRNLIRR